MPTMRSYYKNTCYILEHPPLLSLGLLNMKYNPDGFSTLMKIPAHCSLFLFVYLCISNIWLGTSLVVQWLRLHLPVQGVWVPWGARIPHASQPKNQNIKQKQYCNKFNKDLKKKQYLAYKNNNSQHFRSFYSLDRQILMTMGGMKSRNKLVGKRKQRKIVIILVFTKISHYIS